MKPLHVTHDVCLMASDSPVEHTTHKECPQENLLLMGESSCIQGEEREMAKCMCVLAQVCAGGEESLGFRPLVSSQI